MTNLLALYVQNLNCVSVVVVLRLTPANDHLSNRCVAIVVSDAYNLVVKHAIKIVAVLLLVVALSRVRHFLRRVVVVVTIND